MKTMVNTMEGDTTNQIKDKKGNPVFVYEDTDYHSTMLDNLNMLRKNRQFCDVILQVGTNQEIHEIYAHKVVLSSASPYFLDMFANDIGNTNGSMNQSSNGHGPQQYRLINSNLTGMNGNGKNGSIRQEFDPEAFDQIIDYAYTARLNVPAEKVREVYAIASRLKITSVASKCGQFLLSTLTLDNCLEVRNLKAVLKDPFLLQSVDGYIKQNFEKFVQNKSTTDDGLLHLKVDFLMNGGEPEEKINERHLLNEVLDWIRNSFAYETLDMSVLTEKKMIMLYYNKDLNQIQDCVEMAEPSSPEELEAVEDYKKMSKRCPHPPLMRSASSSVDNINVQHLMNGKDRSSVPSKPRQFLFARSDSESSLSSIADNDDEQEWKLLANCRIGEHTIAGLVTIAGQLSLLTMKLRVNSNKDGSKNNSIDGSDYCLIPPMSSPRCAVGTAELGGKLFVCGGYDRGECLKTVEIYDSTTNKWETLKHMQVPRGRFAIAVVDGNVYAIGGCDGQNELNSAEFYDSITLNWKLIQSAPVVRSNAGVCSMNSKIFVIGGWSGNRGLTRCDMYDPDCGKWSEIGQLHTGRYQTGVCCLNGIIYAVGGCDSWSCLNSVEAYINESWRLVAPLQTARRGCGVAAYNGKIYAVGGHDGVHALCSIEVYDSNEDQWTFGKPMTMARANVGVAVVGTRLYAVGGFNGKTFLNTVEYFDFETEEWSTSVPMSPIGSLSTNAIKNDDQLNGTKKLINVEVRLADMNVHDNVDTPNESNSNNLMVQHKNSSINGKVPLKNSLSSEPLVEVEETLIGH